MGTRLGLIVMGEEVEILVSLFQGKTTLEKFTLQPGLNLGLTLLENRFLLSIFLILYPTSLFHRQISSWSPPSIHQLHQIPASSAAAKESV